jgi:hypothetical protein
MVSIVVSVDESSRTATRGLTGKTEHTEVSYEDEVVGGVSCAWPIAGFTICGFETSLPESKLAIRYMRCHMARWSDQLHDRIQ